MEYLEYSLQQRRFECIDLDHIPHIFRDHQHLDLSHSQEMMADIYPILKLLLKFYHESTQRDYSYKNVVNRKLNLAFKGILRKSIQEDDGLELRSSSFLGRNNFANSTHQFEQESKILASNSQDPAMKTQVTPRRSKRLSQFMIQYYNDIANKRKGAGDLVARQFKQGSNPSYDDLQVYQIARMN